MNRKRPFERVVEDHGQTVARVCRAILGPHPDADEAWSETFASALEAWPDLSEDTNIRAWLVTVAHRKAIDVTRRRGRQAIPVEDPSELASSSAGSETENRIERRELWTQVGELAEKQRMAIAYHFLAGLPYKNVAEILGGTTEAARRAASDGISQLRRKLENEDSAKGEPR